MTQTTADPGMYRQQSAMTEMGPIRTQFEQDPNDIGAMTRVAQGLILHQHVSPEYGVELTSERIEESHLRPLEAIFHAATSHDGRPLTEPRSLECRVIGTCRDFTVFTVAMLRNAGVPARARCGFGMYFEPGRGVDHWVAEYWNEGEARWVLVDAQLDELQQRLFRIDFDVLDVPRDRFLVAGDAWARCREGVADPGTFGILDMAGLWFIAGNVVRDLAALNGREMLPWDVWGAMPLPGSELTPEQLDLFDHVAAVTREPHRHADEVRQLYQDDRFYLPGSVFNAVRDSPEEL